MKAQPYKDSVIVSPEGKFIAGPVHEAEGILYAEIDPRAIAGPRWMLDVAGHYARPDVFQLSVLRQAKAVIGEHRTAPKARSTRRTGPKKRK